jgi:hypothetical protein
MDVIVFDLAQLQFRRTPARTGDGSVLSVHAAHVGLLFEATLDEDVSDREVVFRALDQMLATFELPTSDGVWCPVALANPFSHQVAFRCVPDTEVFSDGDPLDIPAFGAFAQMEGDVLVIGERVLPVVQPDARTTQASLASHSLLRPATTAPSR